MLRSSGVVEDVGAKAALSLDVGDVLRDRGGGRALGEGGTLRSWRVRLFTRLSQH